MYIIDFALRTHWRKKIMALLRKHIPPLDSANNEM